MFCRPSRDFSILHDLHPALKGWAIFRARNLAAYNPVGIFFFAPRLFALNPFGDFHPRFSVFICLSALKDYCERGVKNPYLKKATDLINRLGLVALAESA